MKNLLVGHNELNAIPEQLGVNQVVTAYLMIPAIPEQLGVSW